MQDVAGRIIDQFSGNMATMMAASGAAAAAASAAATPSADGTTPAPVAAAVTPPPIQAAEAIDLGSVAAAPVAKRAIPVVIGLIVIGAIIWWLVKK